MMRHRKRLSRGLLPPRLLGFADRKIGRTDDKTVLVVVVRRGVSCAPGDFGEKSSVGACIALKALCGVSTRDSNEERKRDIFKKMFRKNSFVKKSVLLKLF
tara:strand:+ start:261 stop:563 length:303 start_codon:yes stop_codon:yes gene_type:complete